MLITAEIQKTRKAIQLTNELNAIIDSMASENKEAKDKLLEKVYAVRTDLLDAQTALEDIVI